MGECSLHDLEQVRFPEGDKIYSQGDPAEAAFLVVKGKIGIYKTVDSRKLHLRTLCGGAIFGVTAVVNSGQRSANAVTLAPSLLVRIPAPLLHQRLDRVDTFVRQLVTTLAENLRDLHRLHQIRPRSIHDYVRQLDDQADNLRKFMINVSMDVERATALAAEVDRLQQVVNDIRATTEGIDDRRYDVIPDLSKLP